MNSDLDTKYSKFNKDSPGLVSDLLLQLEVRSSGMVALARPKGQTKCYNLPSKITVGKGKRWVNNPTRTAHPNSVLERGEAHGNTVLWTLLLWGTDPWEDIYLHQ